MKKFSKVLSLLLVFAMIVPGIAQAATVDAEEAAVVTRISGGNRYQTAANVSNQKFGKSKTVVLASGENWPDALAGTALAGVEGAPILLTAARRLHPDTKAELISLGAEKVIIVGGETVIPAAVADELKAMGLTVDRKEGLKREDTAVAAAKGMTSKTAIIANGYESFADALSAGAYAGMNGMPILFVRQNSVPAGTLEGLKALGIENVIIAGGTSAVSAKVQSELAAYNPTRIYGDDREKTSLAFAEKFENNKEVIIANGYDYADALAGAALGAKIGAPVVLVNTNSVKTVVKKFIGENADKNHTVIGGTSAVSNNVVSDIEEIIAPVEEDELKVVSVSAINGSQIEVIFSEAVTKADVITAGAPNNVTITKVGAASTTPGTLTASLSEDETVLTITSDSKLEGSYSVEVADDTITSKANPTKKFSGKLEIIEVKDTVAPTVTGVEYGITDATIKFSEPLSSLGTVSLDGVAIAGQALEADNMSTKITGLAAGKSYVVSIVGAKDVAGNYISPNPTTVNLSLTEDKVKPTVAITAENTTITLEFSEKIKTTAGTLDVNGTNVAFSALTPIANTNKYTYDASALVTGSFLNATVKVTAYEDLAGNVGDDVTATLLLTKDTTAPKFVSALTKGKVIAVKFDEEVKNSSLTTVAIKYTDKDNVVKNLPTVAVTAADGYDVNGDTVMSDDDKTYIALDVANTETSILNTAKTDLLPGTYEVTIAAGKVTDAVTPPNATTAAVKFTVEVVAGKAETDAIVEVHPTNTKQVALTPGAIEVEYNNEMGASALDYKNYKLAGVTIPSTSELYFDGVKTKVRINLPEGYIAVAGARLLEVSNVTDKDGNTLKAGKTSADVNLLENVRPQATKVELIDAQNLKVTFSEALAGEPTTGVKVKVNGTEIGLDGTTPFALDGVTDKTMTIKADSATAFKLTDTITVEFSNTDAADAAGNTVKDITLAK